MSRKLQHIQHLRWIFQDVVESVKPAKVLKPSKEYALYPEFSRDMRRLNIKIHGETLDVTHRKCHVVGFGKAALSMAIQLEHCLEERLQSGVISIPLGLREQIVLQQQQNPKFGPLPKMLLSRHSVIEVIEGAPNNQPDEKAHEAAKRIKDLAASMTENDILFVLISGGGSALLPLPRAPLTLTEKMELVKSLSNCGASIDEMNVVRIALSDIKGGRLAAAARNAYAVISFVISDVIGDPIDIIASGPTCGTITKRSTAKEVLEKYEIWSDLPEHIRVLVEQPEATELCSPGDNNYIYVVANNRMATERAAKEALDYEYLPFIVSTTVEGEVQHLVKLYKDFMQSVCDFRKGTLDKNEMKKHFPFDESIFENFLNILLRCKRTGQSMLLIFSGEPTVKVTGSGMGGRNQELALRMALTMYENEDFKNIIFLSAGTDGIDGPTPAAGAIGCDSVINEFLKDTDGSLSDVLDCLENNDSYNFYKNLYTKDYHILTGHTGTNVMDLQFILFAKD